MKRRSDDYEALLSAVGIGRIQDACAFVTASRSVLGYMDVARAMVLSRAAEGEAGRRIDEAMELGAALGISRQTLTNWFKNDLSEWVEGFTKTVGTVAGNGRDTVTRTRRAVSLVESDLRWIAQLRQSRGRSWRQLWLTVRWTAEVDPARRHLRGLAYSTIWRNRGKITALGEMPQRPGQDLGMARKPVRVACEADATELVKLVSDLGIAPTTSEVRRRLERILPTDNQIVMVYLKGRDLLGWLHGVEVESIGAPRSVKIIDLIVSVESRRTGVGRALVAEVEAWASRRGTNVISSSFNVLSSESHGFFVALNYEPLGTQAGYRKCVAPISNTEGSDG